MLWKMAFIWFQASGKLLSHDSFLSVLNSFEFSTILSKEACTIKVFNQAKSVTCSHSLTAKARLSESSPVLSSLESSCKVLNVCLASRIADPEADPELDIVQDRVISRKNETKLSEFFLLPLLLLQNNNRERYYWTKYQNQNCWSKKIKVETSSGIRYFRGKVRREIQNWFVPCLH